MLVNSKLVFIFLLMVLCLPSFAQTHEGDIEMEKTFLGTKFIQDQRTLRPKEVLNAMVVDEEAFNIFKKAKSNYDAAQVFGYIGGLMIGWPVGTALGGGDPKWGLAGAGAGVLLLSIPFSSAFNKHARTAVNIYNGGSATIDRNRLSVQLVPYGTGAKMIVSF